MIFANVDGQRREATRGVCGTCPVCEVVLTPRCGRFRVPHWAHPPGIVDHRWEPKTDWHRTWKGYFPHECQEVVHQTGDGTRHIADVKTAHGQVIEFQNSAISEEERRSREEFYRPMLWVVNGKRLKTDRAQFFEALRSAAIANTNPLTLIVSDQNCMLLRKWSESRVLVFFDFGEEEDAGDLLRFGAPVLWASDPRRPAGRTVVIPIFRRVFLDAMINGAPLKGMDFSKVFGHPVRRAVPQIMVPRPSGRTPRPPQFRRYSSWKRKAWRNGKSGGRLGPAEVSRSPRFKGRSKRPLNPWFKRERD